MTVLILNNISDFKVSSSTFKLARLLYNTALLVTKMPYYSEIILFFTTDNALNYSGTIDVCLALNRVEDRSSREP